MGGDVLLQNESLGSSLGGRVGEEKVRCWQRAARPGQFTPSWPARLHGL